MKIRSNSGKTRCEREREHEANVAALFKRITLDQKAYPMQGAAYEASFWNGSAPHVIIK